MEFKKRKEKQLPILKYKVSGNAIEDCKERFVVGITFNNKNLIPNCDQKNSISRIPSFYTDGIGDVVINLGGREGSFTVWRNGVFADIIP